MKNIRTPHRRAWLRFGLVSLALFCASGALADDGGETLGEPYFQELRARAKSAFDELEERIDDEFNGGAQRKKARKIKRKKARKAANESARREAQRAARLAERQAREAREASAEARREAAQARADAQAAQSAARAAERAAEEARSAQRASERATQIRATQARRAQARARRAQSSSHLQRREITPPTSGASFEERVLTLVNRERARGGDCGGTSFDPAPPLSANRALRRAAQLHAEAMERQRFFDHRDPSGEGPKERIDAEGYSGRAWGENIAAGQRSPESVMRAWMRSPGHCKNILNPLFNELGVGLVLNAQGPYRTYWVQNFGRGR